MTEERTGDLAAYATIQTGAAVSHVDIAAVLGITRATYHNWRKDNRVGATEVLAVARHYGFNELQALLDLGHVDTDTTVDFVVQTPGLATLVEQRTNLTSPRTRKRRTRAKAKLNPAVQP